MSELSELMAHCTDGKRNEATAFPYWAIVTNTGAANPGRKVIHAGIWFSREDAENHLTARSYAYPKKATVYCFSGHPSADYRRLVELSRETK